MTEKRFKIDLDEEAITDNGEFCLSLYCFQDKGEKDVCGLLNELAEENEQLKSELSRYKEVNRFDIWKSSYSSEDALITELQNKCDKKQEHIVVLENKIRRMREAIHKLEWLASHRNGELIRENKQLKQRINSRLHFYRELYDSTHDDIVKRVVEDLEDILKR